MMNLNSSNIIGRGAFADVFRVEEKAIKLFKRRETDGHLDDQPNRNEEALSRVVWQSEVEAYEIAKNDISIGSHIPQFFGAAEIEKVVSPAGVDISREYLLNCAYVMKYIDATFAKCNPANIEELNAILTQFKNAGIRHTNDVSWAKSNGKIIIIDFATRDAYFQAEQKY